MSAIDVETHDVVIVGAGPAGLATARGLVAAGIQDVVVLDREDEAGGVPRHCGHTGFGLREFGRLMSGPAFARRSAAAATGATIRTAVTVSALEPGGRLRLATPDGPQQIVGRRVLLAMGVRETPRAPRLISGTRPWGVTTTGALQQLVYLAGLRPFSRAVIVGSELVSFSTLLTMRSGRINPVAMIEENARITARRPGDLIARYLFCVPVLTETKLVAIEGGSHITGVVVESRGVRRQIECDGVVFTGGFRPESALLESSHLISDPCTGGPLADQYGRCSDPAYFATGNLIHPVETAGRCYRDGLRCAKAIIADLSARLPTPQSRVRVSTAGALRYLCPALVSFPDDTFGSWSFNARASHELRGRLSVVADGTEVWSRRLHVLPERRLTIPSREFSGRAPRSITVALYGA
ncbi:MAG: FAD-dependent oxidoreductase [Kiloniellales bacterium]